MSRCFTLPLVIVRNQASGQNLVEPTKIERITIGLKKSSRIEKEKNERRKENKEKHEKSHKRFVKIVNVDQKHQLLSSKKILEESDQLEKSDLTEELNHLGYLSDGSQNSKKRKSDGSPPAVESLVKAAVAGNPLRIRLILRKPKAEVSVLPEEDFVCSKSVAKSLGHKDDITSIAPCSKPEENLPSIVETKERKKHKPSKEERYNSLFDDWNHSSLSLADSPSLKDDDHEWLFGNKRQENLNPVAAVKIVNEEVNMSLHRFGDSSWPRAQFLSEVAIHSLPYTVPF